MANSYVQYTGNGVNYAVPFQYLSKTHVTVKVNGSAVPFTWTSSNMVQLNSDPGTALVEVRRTTPNNARLIDFTDGSVLASDDLDNSALQFLFLSQEAQDVANLAIQPASDGGWDAGTRRVENAGDPVGDQDLVTVAWAKTAQAAQLAGAIQAKNDAQAAAGASATSAANSSASQSAAAGSQAAAKTSEQAAAGSASAAAGSATTAGQQASAASTSAGNAKTSETNAKTSETNAAGSATAAAGSANAASASLGQALQAVTDAQTQAQHSAQSAGNAATSEGNAATYAQQAQQAATNAVTGGYTKNEMDQKLLTKADKTDTYTKAQVDQQVGAKADASTTYTKNQVDTAVGGKFSAAGGTFAKTSTVTFKSSGEVGGSDGVGLSSLIVSGDGSDCAQIGLVNEGRYGIYLGLRSTDHELVISGWSLGAYQSYKVFNQHNLNPLQGVRLANAGDMTGPNIEGVSMNNSGGTRATDIVEPYYGAVVTGLAGRNDLWDLLYGARWRYLQVQDQNGQWNTVSYS
jgi:hypothetical protein